MGKRRRCTLKSESGSVFLYLFKKWCRTLCSIALAVLYFLAAHAYDGVCYAVSNMFTFPKAIVIMYVILLAVSAALVSFQELALKYWHWDALGLEALNVLKDEKHISSRRIFKRLARWMLRKGHWWIFGIGSVVLGPPIITPMLEKRGSKKSRLFYLMSGTFVSTAFWVTVWNGVGKMTWNQYVVPTYTRIF